MPKQTFELFSEGFSELKEINRWTLVGGTALSIHYHHRLSEDLGFLSNIAHLKSRLYALKEKMSFILLENSLIHCVKNCSPIERMEKVATARDIG